MIVSLRGTNGAGKSTIVREVMKMYDLCDRLMVTGRRNPVAYRLTRNRRSEESSRPLYIPGHYEIANGGIDTLPDLSVAYRMIVEADAAGMHVLYEGKNMSDGLSWVTNNIKPERITIIHVAHPVEDCIASVRQRGHSIQEKTIRSIRRKVDKQMEEFNARSYHAITLDREAALAKIKELLA